MTTAAQAAEAADLGRATARKTGRNPRFPYVPVVIELDDRGVEHQRQLLVRAFVTRDEAVGYAQRHIDLLRESLARRLAMPNMRALRSQYGVDA